MFSYSLFVIVIFLPSSPIGYNNNINSIFVLVWDRRKKVEAFSLKICDEYISSLCSFDENSTIACTAGNGTVAGINMNTRRIVSKVNEIFRVFITFSLLILNIFQHLLV